MTAIDNEPLLTTREVAKKFNIKESRVRWEIFKGKIPFFKIGSSVRLRASDVEYWILSTKRGVR